MKNYFYNKVYNKLLIEINYKLYKLFIIKNKNY